jgi:hypothetical protein
MQTNLEHVRNLRLKSWQLLHGIRIHSERTPAAIAGDAREI